MSPTRHKFLSYPIDENYQSDLFRFKVQAKKLTEIVSCTVMKDGLEKLTLEYIKGTVSSIK